MMKACVCAVMLAAAAGQPQRTQRQRPPEAVTCPRDHLTVYTGKVVELRRETGQTTLRIRTDWDTDERVVLRHPGTNDPSPAFLLNNMPFGPDGWRRIESAPGRLRENARASAWVCDDGRSAVVDWIVEPAPR